MRGSRVLVVGYACLKQLVIVGLSGGLIVMMLGAADAPPATLEVETGTEIDPEMDADRLSRTVGVMVGWGSVGVGNGGVNPVSYSLVHWHLPAALVVWIDQHEIYASLFPGIYYSWRTAATGFYLTLGLGAALADGVNAGIVSSIAAGMGYNFCFLRYVCLAIEYKNSLGTEWLLVPSIAASHWSVRTHVGMMFER